MLWIALCTHIPYEQVAIEKKSHPWLNTRCENAIKRKNEAEGSATFDETRAQCSQCLVDAHLKYIAKLKTKISKLKKGSKQWWRLNRQLLNKRSKLSSVPPLREGTAWLNTSKEKADLFAKTFASKTALPPETVDCPFFGAPDPELSGFVVLRSRYTAKLFKALDESKATGPDQIPVSILKQIGKEIATPFTRLCRRLLKEGCWPRVWRVHHICPLYKRGSAFNPGNYRGVHLTAVLSKIAEKIIRRDLVSYLHTGKFGMHQWTFIPGLSARDLVTALVMS